MRVARLLIPAAVAAAVFALAFVLAGGEEAKTSDGSGAKAPQGTLDTASVSADAPQLAQLGSAPDVPGMKPKPTPTPTPDPGPTDPGPTDPGPTDPGPTDPGPTDPGPTDPGPTDPGDDDGGFDLP
jgi:molecular chaperone DnaK